MNKLHQQIIRDLSSRKWLAFLLVECLSFWGLKIGKISGAEWEVISLAALGLFAGSNVYQKIKAKQPPNQR
jgi:hypothetical protein